MRKPFTLLLLGLAGSPCLADLSEQRLSRDDATSQDPRFYALAYYLSDQEDEPMGSAHPDVQEEIFQPPSKWGQFIAVAEDSVFWSNNLGQTDTDTQDGWGWGAVVGVHWRKPIVRDWLVNAYAYQDTYSYSEDFLDYESSELGAGVMKLTPSLGDLTLFARYEFLYLRADDVGGDIHKRLHSVRVGAGKTLYRSKQGTASVYLGVNSSYDFDASSGDTKRFQHSGRLSGSYRLTDRFSATAYYRLSFRDYLNSSRQDWHQNVGVELSYSLTDWAEIYASSVYSYNDSNESGSDYEAFEGSLSAGVTATF